MQEDRNSIDQSLEKRARAHNSRLPTLQPARDLTLGSGGSRRTFLPNVNAKKQKDPVPVKTEPKKEPRDSSRRNREPRAPREKKKYIQSYSIFADGPAVPSNLGKNDRSSYPVGGGGNRGLRLGGSGKGGHGEQKKALDKLTVKKEDHKRECFISDLMEGDMVPSVYPRHEPHPMPPKPAEILSRGGDDDDYEELGLIQLLNPMPVESNSPGIDPVEDDDVEGVDFTRLPEGEFAKLQILDTGEVRLVIGDKKAMVKVLNGNQVNHLMELVRVRTTEEESNDTESTETSRRTGEMHVLGRIENRFVCATSFESVFHEMAFEREANGHDSDSDFDER